jgi:YVTN family beta-propeller protein
MAALAQEAPPKTTPRKLPGVQGPGHVLLPTQWSLRPAGKQLKLGDFPVNVAIHPRDRYAAVLHAGFGDHEIMIVDLDKQTVLSSAKIPQTFYGLTFSPDGGYLFASGGEHEVVHRFQLDKGLLHDHVQLKVGDAKKDKLVPAGIATSADGDTVYVACGWGFKLALMSPNGENVRFVEFEKNSYPYTALPTKDNARVYVSLWGGAGVAVVDPEKLNVTETWKTSSHPTEMALSPDESLLYVACANSNSVHVIDTKTGETLEVISSALYPKAQVGSTPNSLALAPDGKALFIANADNNNVAVFDVRERAASKSLGYLPVGWYPTSVRFDPKNGRIYVANGKGLMSQANPQGPQPLAEKDPPASIRQYIGGLFRGTLSIIEPPGPAEMAKYTRLAFTCSPLQEDDKVIVPPSREDDNPIPAKVGDKSPLKHCIYVIKENRTYDQVFGDVKEGNGEPSLCIFPEKVTPNHHKLVREFVLLDNFYVESEVSADGHEWTMAGYATDFVEKSWPLSYRGGLGKLTYPAEGSFEIARSSGGYLWDRCAEAKVSYRSYGEFIANPKKRGDPATARVKGLEGHFDPFFWGYDLDYPDQKRADRFIEELARFEKEGEMPQLIVLRLPNDHTYGTSPGKPTPTAMVADNDLALGRVVDAVSHSKFWKDTAFFVVQDDAQNGSDHIDAHRTVALVISPYTKRKFVDSSMYSTASMLRTMELILGLKPMSQFDAAALPMFNSFTAKSDPTPYDHVKNNVPLDAVNLASAWGADVSRQLDFSKEDVADDLLLNEVVWRSVRGPHSKMPAPVRASFVFAHAEEDEDEDDDDD